MNLLITAIVVLQTLAKTMVYFLQTNGSPEVNSPFIWSQPSWEIFLLSWLYFFLIKRISFDIFHIQKGENAIQKQFISVQREKWCVYQALKPSWLNITTVFSGGSRSRTCLDRLGCNLLSVWAKTERTFACHQC